jgi:MinD superfamily P-loop ATPase
LDADSCTACGDCIERCQFHALSLSGAAVDIDLARCMGCGICVVACPTEGLRLERRKTGEVSLPPTDIGEWRAQRSSSKQHVG